MSARVRVPAYAKVNLSLLVLHKQPTGFHELRTVLQTVSLTDRLDIEFTPGVRTNVEVASDTPIEGPNLAASAADRVLEALRIRGRVRIGLQKKIPMGAGMGGGSSDAAAVLLALPVMCGKAIEAGRLHDMAAALGSDVPFFLMGGTALGIGRGTELYPLAGPGPAPALMVKPEAGVATAGAYAALGRPVTELTSPEALRKMKRFQLLAQVLDCPDAPETWKSLCENDFEAAVFPRHPELAQMARALRRLGAEMARMTGSGSALFALFRNGGERDAACVSIRERFPGARVEPIRLLSRGQYRAGWRRALGDRIEGKEWPPRGRNFS
ncbi:MAG: 4-(cytidine 5'-diphospho)-2-C-methyl-D-erythritol kinase [Bryobacteraceae bacterium]